MNIFLFTKNLDRNARYFKSIDPKRFNKQIVESTQLFAASMKHYYGVDVIKADGTPYVVNRILHHPACKWLLADKTNHLWHIRYILCLIKLSPNHACGKSVTNALSKIVDEDKFVEPSAYLRLTNTDMSSVPKNAKVFAYYRMHLKNKHGAEYVK